jgi:hypothetical protein
MADKDILDSAFSAMSGGKKELKYKGNKVVSASEAGTYDPSFPEVKETPLGAGVQEGALDLVRGARYLGQKGLEKIGIMDEGGADAYKQSLEPGKQEYAQVQKEYPVQSGIGEALGATVALAPLGAPGSALAKSGALPGMLSGLVGQSAVTGAAQGAAGRALDIDNSGNSLLGNLGTGAAVGAGVGAVAGMLPTAMNAGKSALASLIKPKVEIDKQKVIQQVAENIGLSPSYGQISGSPTAESIEGFMAGVPFSKIRGQRLQQVDDIEPAVTNYIKSLRGKLGDIPEESFTSNIKRIQGKVESQASEKYKYAAQLAKDADLTPEKDGIKTFLMGELEKYNAMPGTYAKRIVSEVNSQLTKLDNLSFDKVDNTVKYLNKLGYQKYLQSRNGTALPDEYNFFYNLRDKYLDSLDASNHPEVKAALVDAKNFFSKEVSPFHDPVVRDLTNQEISVDKFLKTMLGEAKAGKTGAILTKLDDSAKSAMRADFLETLQKEAVNQDGSLNTSKFLGKIQQYSALHPQIFEKELPKFEAFTSLLSRLKPEKDLGNMQVGMGGTFGSVAAAGAAVAYPASNAIILPAAGALWLYSKMATSQTGITALQALSKIKPGTNPQIAGRIQESATKVLTNIMRQMPNSYNNKAEKAQKEQDILDEQFRSMSNGR